MSELKLQNKTVGRGRAPVLVAFGLWLCAMSAGALWMNRYSNIPGPTENAPGQWPGQSVIALARTNSTLVMFVHPHCPCTQASLSELEILMTRMQGRITAHVLFLKPPGLPASWTQTSFWRKAAAIPGVTVEVDSDGAEARRFGSGTSGDTLVYGPDRGLMFHGGITISRGHEGDNPGLKAIIAHSQVRPGERTQTPVFGCSLFATKCSAKGLP